MRPRLWTKAAARRAGARDVERFVTEGDVAVTDLGYPERAASLLAGFLRMGEMEIVTI
jgi:hypothetical protein